MMRLIALTSDGFDALANTTWVADKNLHLAREVLVMGVPAADVARAHGESPQLVNKACNYIRREYDQRPTDRAYLDIERPVPARLAPVLAEVLDALQEDPTSDDVEAVLAALRAIQLQLKSAK